MHLFFISENTDLLQTSEDPFCFDNDHEAYHYYPKF